MKKQDAIKILEQLTSSLRDSAYDSFEDYVSGASRRVEVSSVDIPRALQMLVALSSFDKQQWIDIIRDYNFPIVVRPRDASRDILGKLLKYLETNPSAREQLARIGTRQRSQTSPELVQALTFLLKP